MSDHCPATCAHLCKMPSGAECSRHHVQLASAWVDVAGVWEIVRFKGCDEPVTVAPTLPAAPQCPATCPSLKRGFSYPYCTEHRATLAAGPARHADCKMPDPSLRAVLGAKLLPHALPLENLGETLDEACGDLREVMTGSRAEGGEIHDQGAEMVHHALSLARDAMYLAARLVRGHAS